ncbi:MAG: hypothetical protein KJZ95_19120 [Caldilinea sp.]|nr:hypothetical protein [Caldilinea sp.]
MDVKPAQIEFAIDELVIDERAAEKLSPRDLNALRVEVERELVRLLGAETLPSQLQRDGRIEEVDGGRLARHSANRAVAAGQLGVQIAQSVYRSLG